MMTVDIDDLFKPYKIGDMEREIQEEYERDNLNDYEKARSLMRDTLRSGESGCFKQRLEYHIGDHLYQHNFNPSMDSCDEAAHQILDLLFSGHPHMLYTKANREAMGKNEFPTPKDSKTS